MGYDPGRLSLVSQGLVSARQFQYIDTGGESVGAYQAVGYFTNATDYGAVPGDPIRVVDQTNDVVWSGYFITAQDTGDTQGTVRFDTGQP
jgi:hypothetical protein